MGWNYIVDGWDGYDRILWALSLLGVRYTQYREGLETSGFWQSQESELRSRGCEPARLRKASFIHPVTKNHIFIEEYVVSQYPSLDKSNTMEVFVAPARYREGERPYFWDWTQYVRSSEKLAS